MFELIKESSDIDTRHSYVSQNTDTFESIYNNVCIFNFTHVPFVFNLSQAKTKFPVLWKYVGCWPINDLLKAYLKNSSGKWQKGQLKKLLEKELTKGTNKRDKKRKSSHKSSPDLH